MRKHLFLALSLPLFIAACGASAPANSEAPSAEPALPALSELPDAPPPATIPQTSAPATTPAPVTPPAPQAAEWTVSGITYTNSVLGLSFRLPSGFIRVPATDAAAWPSSDPSTLTFRSSDLTLAESPAMGDPQALTKGERIIIQNEVVIGESISAPADYVTWKLRTLSDTLGIAEHEKATLGGREAVSYRSAFKAGGMGAIYKSLAISTLNHQKDLTIRYEYSSSTKDPEKSFDALVQSFTLE